MSESPAHKETEVFRFPASFSQKAIWYIEQTSPGIRAYELANGAGYFGDVQEAELGAAIQQVSNRHEALRCYFEEKDGDLWQIVPEQAASNFRIVNVTQREQAEAALQDFLDARFDLTNGPLFHALLIAHKSPAKDEPSAYLAFKFHHIIVDQLSIQLVSDEISQCYQQLTQGKPCTLPDKELDYADFVVWQQEEITREKLAPKLSFWKDNINEPIGCINLPTDRPRGLSQSFTGGEIRRPLASGLTDKVAKFSQAVGVSPFTTLLTGYSLVLGRYANQDQVMVGVPFGNRAADESLESVVGLFINTLPIPLSANAKGSFKEQVEHTRQTFVSAQACQDVPLEFVLESVPLVRDPSYNPMFQVGFSFQPPPAVLQLNAVDTVDLQLHPHASPFDVQMWILDYGPGNDYGVQVWYSDALFDRESIERLITVMESMLDRCLDTPDAPTHTIPLLENAPSIEPGAALQAEQTIPALIDLTGKPAQAIALQSAGETLTYAALHQRVCGIQKRLQDGGLVAGDRVGVLMDRGIDLVPALLGILSTGAAYVPLDPNYPAELLAYVAEDAGLAAIIANRDHQDQVATLACDKVLILEDSLNASDDTPTGCAVATNLDPTAAAYVIYTSGSTGRPKGVEIPHSAAANLLASMVSEPGIDSDDRLVAVTTLSFDISVLELFAPLVAGATTVVATYEQSRDVRQLETLLNDSQATMLQATPSTWRLLVEQGFTPSPGFRALCGGEPLPSDLATMLLPKVAALWNLYGPTETTVWSTAQQITDPASIRIGRPIANTQLYILDRYGNPLPAGVPGELHIGGAGLARGYLHQPGLTEERFICHPQNPGERVYRTGDLVRVDNSGMLEHLGRLDHQIKIRGFRVELGQIEAVLNDAEGVAESVVYAKQITAGDQRLIGYVVAKPGATLSISGLRRHLRNTVPEYMVPQFLVTLDALPRTPNGKIDRNALPEPQELTASTFDPPANDVEQAVADIWARLIGIEKIGRADNFFAAGGHSLLAMKALSEISQATGLELDLRALTTRSLSEICSATPMEPALESARLQVLEASNDADAPNRDKGFLGRVRRIFNG